VGRYIFGRTSSPRRGQIFIMVYIASSGAAVAPGAGLHLRMDVLVHLLPRRRPGGARGAELGWSWCSPPSCSTYRRAMVVQMAGLDARSQNAGIPMCSRQRIVLGFGLIAVLAVLQIVQLSERETHMIRLAAFLIAAAVSTTAGTASAQHTR